MALAQNKETSGLIDKEIAMKHRHNISVSCLESLRKMYDFRYLVFWITSLGKLQLLENLGINVWSIFISYFTLEQTIKFPGITFVILMISDYTE